MVFKVLVLFFKPWFFGLKKQKAPKVGFFLFFLMFFIDIVVFCRPRPIYKPMRCAYRPTIYSLVFLYYNLIFNLHEFIFYSSYTKR